MSRAPLRLVTFDLDDTLWPIEDVLERAESAWCAWLTREFPRHELELSAEFLRKRALSLVSREPDLEHNLTEWRVRVVEEFFLEQGMTRSEARDVGLAAFREFHVVRNQVTPFDDVLGNLGVMSQRYVLGALTNGNADLSVIGMRHLFAFHHSSETVGRRKPHEDMFVAALRSAGVTAAESLHVGDHPHQDVEAARRVGFRAVWMNRNGASWPRDLASPEREVTTLIELLAFLSEQSELSARVE